VDEVTIDDVRGEIDRALKQRDEVLELRHELHAAQVAELVSGQVERAFQNGPVRRLNERIDGLAASIDTLACLRGEPAECAAPTIRSSLDRWQIAALVGLGAILNSLLTGEALPANLLERLLGLLF
jgi:hypothetical protein